MPIESGHAGGHQHAGSVVPAGTTTTSAPPPVASNTQQGWLKALGDAALAGSVSGMVARCFIHPADTVKAQLQVQGALRGTLAYQSTVHAVKQIARTQGASGFYKGFGVAVVGTAPGNMAYFGGYEIGKAIVPTTGWEASGDMAVGAIAQLIAGVVFNPIDIIKERLQSQAIMSKVYTYNGGMDAIRDLLNKSGPAGLLKGYWVTNAAWIPWNMMFVAMYELFDMVSLGLILMVSHLIVSTLQRSKASAAQHVVCSGRTEELPPAVTASCAFASAACAAAATTPVDVVKTRLQVLRPALPSKTDRVTDLRQLVGGQTEAIAKEVTPVLCPVRSLQPAKGERN